MLMLNEVKYNELMNSYDNVLVYYTLQMIRLAEDDGLLVNHKDEYITSFKELWDSIGCKDGGTRAKIKDYMFYGNLIKPTRVNDHKAFQLNKKYFKILRNV